jgi:two-component system LytT family response regulator
MTLGVARVVVADDEPLARERLRRLLRAESEVHLVGEAATGPDALTLIRKQNPHIALLDIRLPGMDAFGVLRNLERACSPSVVFVTAFGDYAIEAFQFGAADYVLKPFEPQRLREALRRARYHCARRLWPSAISPVEAQPSLRLSLKTGGRVVVVEWSEVEYILAANSRCRVFTKRGCWLVTEPLGAVTGRLPAGGFVRISRFAVVNLAAVISVRTKSHGDQVLELRAGTQLTVARTRRAEVLARLAGRH